MLWVEDLENKDVPVFIRYNDLEIISKMVRARNLKRE
jgi:hypothetical protein